MNVRDTIINYPFNKCLHPTYVFNKYNGRFVEVACGKCDSCLLSRSQHYKTLCNLQEQDSKFTMFVTLTYTQDNVCSIQPVTPSSDIFSDEPTYFIVNQPKRWSKCDFIDGNKILSNDKCSVFSYKKYNQSYDDCVYLNKLLLKVYNVKGKQLPYGYIPVLNKHDLQNFIKRFRNYAKKILGFCPEIKYFGVGEYGPKTFRPHYHLLFYFDDSCLFDVFGQIISSAWQFGRVDFSRSRGKCSGYLSGYLNNYTRVPAIHAIKATKPFIVHSSYFGTAFYRTQKEKVYKQGLDYLVEHVRQLGDHEEFISAWRNLKNIFYPKVRYFSSRDDKLIYRLYVCYHKAQLIFGKNYNITDLTGLVIETDLPYFAPLLYDTPDSFDNRVPRNFNQVYHDLLISKHFINFVCDGNYNNSFPKFKMIKEFYSRCELASLRRFYQAQECWSDIDYHYFYDNFRVDYDRENLVVYKAWNSYITVKADSSIKHKEQNDLNIDFYD